MEDFSLQELPAYWIAAGVVAVILILWIAAGWLWNNRYRPLMVKRGKPTPTFNNALQRIFRFLFKEDTQPPKKAKNALVRKLVNWRNTYILLILASIIMPLLLGYSPLAPLVLLFLIAFTRVRKVFRERNAILHRMFEVANSEFRYKKEASLNPWAYVNIQKWENLTTPGKTIVTFPPAFRVDSPMKRQEFQQHFDGTVAEENVWSYEWSGAKGIVECAPVPHLPTMAPYPGSEDRPWDQIPLGLGINGEVVWSLSDVPHLLVCGSTGGGKELLKETPILSKEGWTIVGDLQQGDIIYDENGKETVVTSAHPIELKDAYEIEFSDGTSLVAGADHLWYTDTQASRASASRQRTLGESRHRNTLLSEEKREELARIIASSLPEETISIPETAELLGVHETSNFLYSIARSIGHAEERQEITAYNRPAQIVKQKQTVSVFDAASFKKELIRKAKHTLSARSKLLTDDATRKLVKWHEDTENNDTLVNKQEICELLGLDPKSKEATSVSNLINRMETKTTAVRPIKYANDVVRERVSMVVSAHEISHALLHLNRGSESFPFITEEFVNRLQALPETGEIDRFGVAEIINIPAGDIKPWMDSIRVKPLRKENKEVALQTRDEMRTHKGRVTKYYAKGLFLEKLVEHGSQMLYDQKDKLVLGEVRTTLDIMNSLRGSDGRANHSLPRVKPVQFPEKELIVGPYTLGAWLGDGYSRDPLICGLDHEVKDKVVKEGYKVVRENAQKGAHEEFRIWTFSDLRPGLRNLGVLKIKKSKGDTKRIPAEYLISSEAQRRELLRGLMDTDGTVDPDGMLSFTTVIPELRDGVMELLRSLGYLPRVSDRIPTNGTGSKTLRRAYTISFSAPPSDRIFALERKQNTHEERYKGNPEVDLANIRYIVDVKPVGQRLMRCISVDSPSRLFLAGEGFVPTHNSVLQRNIIFHTIQHSDKIKFLGVDLKRVELDPYAKYEDTVLGIAKTLEDGVEVMRYARDAMMERYEIMEQMGVNHFMAMNNPPPALLVMVDEAYMFMAPSGGKTDEQKEQDQLHGEATVIIGDIARLGRAAGVHLVLATQRPDAKVIYGEIKANLGARYMAGRSGSTPSLMVLDSDTGTRIPDIKGRGVVSFNGDEEFIQGYFAEQDWIDGWLARKNNQEDAANEELLQIEAGSASSADEPMDDEDIQPDENGVYPKKKKAKKKRNSRKKFRGLKPVPDFDDGELSYGEASEVPKEVLKRTSKKARGKSGEEIDPREFDMDSELNSSDFEDSESFTQPTPQPAPSFVGHLDEEAEGNENDEMDRFIPTPVATPALSIEDEEEDEGFADPFASRPKLTGASSIKKDNDLVWDDDLDSVFEDVSHNIPIEQAKSPKKELPARPVLPTTASKKVAETPAGTPAWQEEQSVPQSPAQKSREVRSAAPEPGSNNPAPAPRKPARRAPSAPEAPAARVAPMPAPPARMPTPPPGAGRLPSAPKTSGLPTIPNAPKPPNASGSTPTPTTLPKLPKLPPSP